MNRWIIAATTFGAFVLLVPSSASAQDPSPTPSYTQRPSNEQPMETGTRPNRFLLIGGGAIVAASYIPAVVVAASSDREGDKWLYVPVLGPWADLVDREGCAGSCSGEAINKALLVLTGVAHIVGVGSIVASFVVPEERTRLATTSPQKPQVQVTPVKLGRSGYGLGIVGAF